ncbi:glycosyltransferase [Rhodobacteraceae bacterium RKSG542]|uniref:glycosyltransferase family 2 protein n=1 Tax=Pseudovibrio flavus TaxID=2529854 RepID=UPI0012BB6697|nr:glycosyltransferase [Pseudovibrio flavus]MTI18202.1 glycosyltransferase [Pseudovibrio flavus]
MADLRISVVIPVKNGEATIASALDSVLIQTHVPAEVIVVDDGSTDSTPQILEAYSDKYPQVRRVVATGSGISDALNQGIAEASGDLIARMDGDDLCFPERFEKQLKEFEKRPDLVLLGSFVETFTHDEDAGNKEQNTTGSSAIKARLPYTPVFAHPSIMMRREAVDQIGGYRKLFDGAEDHDLYLRLSKVGEVDILPQCLLRYRVHAGQISQVKKAKGLCASVGAAYSAMCVDRGLTDRAVNAASTQELVIAFLNEIANGEIPINKQLLKVVTRAFAGLRETSKGQQIVKQLSRKIAGSLMKSGHPLQAFRIYRHGRK